MAANPEDVLQSSLDLISKLVDAFNGRLEESRKKKEEQWEQVAIALDMLRELVANHVEAIKLVLEPAVRRGEIEVTVNRYGELVYDQRIPAGYDTAKGVLYGARDLKQFQKSPTREKLEAVLDSTKEFQYVAFQVEGGSYKWCDHLQAALDLKKALGTSGSDIEARKGWVLAAFLSNYDWLARVEKRENTFTLPAIDSADDVDRLVREWCGEYERALLQVYVGGYGVNRAISELKMERNR